MNSQKAIEIAKQVLKIESDSIAQLMTRLDSSFEKAVELVLSCQGNALS